MVEYDLDRDALALEPHFTKHMSAMTGEGLHSKSDIACELAYRDCEITRLRDQLADADALLIAWAKHGNYNIGFHDYRKKWGKDA